MSDILNLPDEKTPMLELMTIAGPAGKQSTVHGRKALSHFKYFMTKFNMTENMQMSLFNAIYLYLMLTSLC